MKLSSDKGCALITGVALLMNCRVLDHNKPHLLTFDAHVYVPGKEYQPDEFLAVVRFYAHNTDVFLAKGPDVGPCFIHATIAAMPTDANALATPGVHISKYDFICNAMLLIPMGSVEGYLPEPSQLIAFGTVNAVVKHTSKKLVFTITPTQYMLGLKDVSSSPRQPFPIRCKIDLTSSRYMKGDGTPWAPDIKPNGRVTVFGAITRLVREGGSGTRANCVKLAVNEVVHCGGGGLLFPTNKADIGSPLQGKGKQPTPESPLKFSFRDLHLPMLNRSSQLSPVSPVSPVIPQKRSRNEDATPAESGPDTGGNIDSESTRPMRIRLPATKRGPGSS